MIEKNKSDMQSEIVNILISPRSEPSIMNPIKSALPQNNYRTYKRKKTIQEMFSANTFLDILENKHIKKVTKISDKDTEKLDISSNNKNVFSISSFDSKLNQKHNIKLSMKSLNKNLSNVFHNIPGINKLKYITTEEMDFITGGQRGTDKLNQRNKNKYYNYPYYHNCHTTESSKKCELINNPMNKNVTLEHIIFRNHGSFKGNKVIKNNIKFLRDEYAFEKNSRDFLKSLGSIGSKIDNKMSKIKKENIEKHIKASSQVDRLIFKLKYPYECFEENFGNKPGDKYVKFKFDMRAKKRQLDKMIYGKDLELIKKYKNI